MHVRQLLLHVPAMYIHLGIKKKNKKKEKKRKRKSVWEKNKIIQINNGVGEYFTHMHPDLPSPHPPKKNTHTYDKNGQFHPITPSPSSMFSDSDPPSKTTDITLPMIPSSPTPSSSRRSSTTDPVSSADELSLVIGSKSTL